VLHLKGLQARCTYKKVSGCAGLILKELEGLPWQASIVRRHRGIVPIQPTHYSILVPYVKDYL
jgi:hypothetical protein